MWYAVRNSYIGLIVIFALFCMCSCSPAGYLVAVGCGIFIQFIKSPDQLQKIWRPDSIFKEEELDKEEENDG